jgi:putative tricarboxylic transport membrane protein
VTLVSDRIAGLLLFALAVWYGWTAEGFEQGFGDPLGPAMFPQLVALPFALLSLVLVARPDAEPAWPQGFAMVRQAATVLVLIGYALALEPLGFPLATFLGCTLLCRLLGADWVRSLAAGAGVGVGLYVLFHSVLGLHLPFAPQL